MNQLQINKEKRKVLNRLKYNSLSGSKQGTFNCYANENSKHMDLKYFTWKLLKKNGYEVWCEAQFKNTLNRPDIICFKNGKFYIIEILSTETFTELEKKIIKYPKDIEILTVKTFEDIKNLEID